MSGGTAAPLSFDAGAHAYERFMGRWSRLWVPALRADLMRGFSLGKPDRLLALLVRAGFHNVRVTRERRTLAMASFEDFWEPVASGGARLGQAYAGLSDEARRAILEEVRARMAPFESGGRFVMEAEALLGVASR